MGVEKMSNEYPTLEDLAAELAECRRQIGELMRRSAEIRRRIRATREGYWPLPEVTGVEPFIGERLASLPPTVKTLNPRMAASQWHVNPTSITKAMRRAGWKAPGKGKRANWTRPVGN
jgi:hypothetical protein